VASSEAQSKIEEIRANANSDIERIRREVAEVDNLIRQTSAEVEKLAQRELTVSNRLRDLEINIEKYGKGDIKNFYTSAQEVQMRLLMMRNQLEQLQFRQQTLKNRQSQLFEIVTALEEFGPVSGGGSARLADDGNDLMANVIQAQEKERLRISLQMHDGPAQSMSNLVLRAEICQRMLERDTDMARSEISGLKGAINNVLQEIRRFIFELRPMILDDLGLVPTLRRYVQQYTEKNKIEVNLITQGVDGRLPPHYEIAIFRFIQEGLSNVAKHAGTSQARVLVDNNGDKIQVIIEDEGSGFSVSDVLNTEGNRRNMGVELLRQQAESLLRGQFEIESQIGRGTRVMAVVPAP
jgi:two-component system sensor histidine kinase DegS